MGENQALHSVQALGDDLSTGLSAGLFQRAGTCIPAGEEF